MILERESNKQISSDIVDPDFFAEAATTLPEQITVTYAQITFSRKGTNPPIRKEDLTPENISRYLKEARKQNVSPYTICPMHYANGVFAGETRFMGFNTTDILADTTPSNSR